MTRQMRALHGLIRIQESEKTRAARELLATREIEHQARAALQQAETTMMQERQIAQTGQSELDDFRTWFPTGLNTIGAAREMHDQTLKGVEKARLEALQMTMTLKATQDVFQRRAKERNDLACRRENAELDELARHRHGIKTFIS